MRKYDSSDKLSIFNYSVNLLGNTLAETLERLGIQVPYESLDRRGKGGLGQLVEEYFFGYTPNCRPEADFKEAGVELKVTPLKKTKNDDLVIKERLVCDMINYITVVNEEFEDSVFLKKSILMLIIFYLHDANCKYKDLKFIYSILWQIKDKDYLIMKQDFLVIREKIRQGKAHELSEGDTLYLGAVRKGGKDSPLKEQPYSNIMAPGRAFSLKASYMRTLLDFVKQSQRNMATNVDGVTFNDQLQLVTTESLKDSSFEDIIQDRFKPYNGLDYQEIAKILGIKIDSKDKSKHANIVRNILLKNVKDISDVEEIKKAGIKIRTFRINKRGRLKEDIPFDNIDYQEVFDCDDWTKSQWYDILTTRYMFIVFREVDDFPKGWSDKERYILDKMFFWTVPSSDFQLAEEYWNNIKENVMNDTLQNPNYHDETKINTFWKISDNRLFHVRPKARNSKDVTISPISCDPVPKKAYWFNRNYILREVKKAYGESWDNIFSK